MIPDLKRSGLLPAGVHFASWEEFNSVFGFNPERRLMISGLKKGLKLLKKYGCKEVCIDGSFVTDKPFPNDVDVCYDNTHMDWAKFIKEHPEFNNNDHGGRIQKEKYQSEFFAYNAFEDYIFQFFQFDRNNVRKGIVKLNLAGINYDKERKAV